MGRPKKRVLLYCADYYRRKDLAFVLRVRCPWARIEAFGGIAELQEDLRDVDTGELAADCVVLVAAAPGDRKADGQRRNASADDLSEQIDFDWVLKAADVAMRTVEVRTRWDVGRGSNAARRVCAADIVALQDVMKALSARRRGPKKAVPAVQAVAETAVA
jgi:hypothetical protein